MTHPLFVLHHRHATLHSEACCYRGKYCRERLQKKFPRFVLHSFSFLTTDFTDFMDFYSRVLF